VRMSTSIRAFLLACACVVLGGCPKRLDPSSDPGLPSRGDPAARSRFQDARQKFERGEHAQAEAELDAILKDYPQDPIAPYAGLYSGMAAFKRNEQTEAIKALEPIARDEAAPDEVKVRARYYLGLSYGRAGRHADAKQSLEPLIGKLAEGEEDGELYAALAEACAGAGEQELALRYYDEFFARARPAERTYIVAKVAAIVDGLPADAVTRAYGSANKDRPAAAFLGRRLAASLRSSGDESGARRVLNETSDARGAAGLEEGSTVSGGEDPRVFGAILPLSGKRRLVGLAAQRGVAIAAGTYDRSGSYSVLVRDAGEGRARAGSAVDDLTGEGVIGLVGPMDRDATEEAAARAEALGVPIVTLDVSGESLGAGSPHVFRIVIPVEARARALAKWGHANGIKRFAILAPELGYGTRAAAAFKAEVIALGGEVVAEATYAKDVTAFVGPVGKIAKGGFDALFIPDTAARLELVAPQLAVADLLARPLGSSKPKRGRNIVVLSTAEALSPKFLRGTGRYTQGAVFAPGFYADEADSVVGDFVSRFRAAYGDDPSYLDAYAYDAALLLRTAVEMGARDRSSLVSALAALRAGNAMKGVTGEVWFDPSRNRGDRGTLYTVVPDGAGGYAIRALR
jgi:branched-chain amino acid transport system substrate-binding protein